MSRRIRMAQSPESIVRSKSLDTFNKAIHKCKVFKERTIIGRSVLSAKACEDVDNHCDKPGVNDCPDVEGPSRGSDQGVKHSRHIGCGGQKWS